MRTFIYILSLVFFSSISSIVYGQSLNQYVRKGNKSFKQEEYSEAERNYRKGLEIDDRDFKSLYNLAAALYKSGKIELADSIYRTLTGRTIDDETLAKLHYNIGNAQMKQEKWEESIKSYINSLKKNPHDLDAKYNLQYAKMMLQQQEQQQQNQCQNNEDNENDDEQDNQSSQNQNQNQQNEQEREQQQQQMSRNEAEKMLDALNRKERQTLEDLKKKPVQEGKVIIEKDW